MIGRLKVAQVVCTDAFAGVERYVTTLAAGLAGRGCDVIVIGGDGERIAPVVEAAGCRWERGPRTFEALARLVRHRNVDLVHAHMTAAELAAVVAAPIVRAPIVATLHFAQRRGSTPPAKLLGKVLTGRMSAQLAISQFVADTTEGASVVVPPGCADRSAPASETRQPVVLVAQRLEAEKRTDLALHLWRESRLQDQGWRLDIAGDGTERHRLEGLTHQLGISSSCRFLGSRSDVETLQQQAAIQIAPRPDEPFGLSVIEAMAAGLPVVAAGGGGHLETVGVVDGAALYPPLDVSAGGLLLAGLASDPARRAAYGLALQEAQRRLFSAGRQISATLDVYSSLTR